MLMTGPDWSTSGPERSATSSTQTLRDAHHLTLGHRPQSIALSTVGGWLACRSAGQYSTRYGKIEDMVVGLEVALADGRLIRTGGTAPRVSHRSGPDPALRRQRRHPRGHHRGPTAGPPSPTGRAASRATRFPAFGAGLDACRRILRRGATPAVLRLYDAAESGRSSTSTRRRPDRARRGRSRPSSTPPCGWSAEESAPAATLDGDLVGRWLEHRNDLPPLESLVRAGIVADTIEVAASWTALPRIYRHRRGCPDRHRRDDRRVGPPVARLPRWWLPLLHRGRATSVARRGRGRGATTAGPGMR